MMTNSKVLNRRKILSVFVAASCLLLLLSCSFFKKPKAMLGRTFYNQSSANISPELGGIDFVSFRSETEAELKRGDIVESCTVTYSNDKISLRGNLSKSTTEFTVENDRLKDSYGNFWDSK